MNEKVRLARHWKPGDPSIDSSDMIDILCNEIEEIERLAGIYIPGTEQKYECNHDQYYIQTRAYGQGYCGRSCLICRKHW